jgi:hypothetical protein
MHAGRAWLVVVALLSCSEHEERVPKTCVGCVNPTGGFGSPGSGGSSGSASGEAGVGAVAGATGSVRLEGELVVLDDFAFEAGFRLEDGASVRAEGEAGSTVSAEVPAGAQYALAGVRSGAEVWVQVAPAAGSLALPTLGPLDTTRPDTSGTLVVDLPLVSLAEIRSRYLASPSPQPAPRALFTA